MTERSIFLAALDIDDPAGRAAYLDQACGADAELRRRVGGLLAAHAAAGSFMDRPAANLDAGPPTRAFVDSSPGGGPSAEPHATGDLLAGRYELVREIGRGGMGTVYLARQVRPVKRSVAVKLIKAGMDSKAVLARFEAERQALAIMDHPNIAKVLDAGTTADGRPFFVMELVGGQPLTEYCDAKHLPVAERLALFRAICQAVQHAHQKGVIHRDLKPGNILVEARDGVAVPKVIDFGLAKAIGGVPLTEETLFTAPGAVAGTPLYMAPEQTDGRGDVDTRADVYALGAVLYELLTGTTPIQRETLKRAALHELLRVIREDEPPAPSSRLGTSDSTPSAAANRGIEPARLGRLVRGDLDWVVMKALEKDRGRRYESAAAFAADVDRFLHHEPVAAGPPTRAYRVRKFVRRNRGPVAAAGLILLAVIGGAAAAGWQAVRATNAEWATGLQLEKTQEAERQARTAEGVAVRRQHEEEKARREAEGVSRFVQDVLAQGSAEGQADLGRVVVRDPTVREAVTRAVGRLATRFEGQPDTEAAVRMTIGETYRGLGAYPEAEAQFRRALALCEAAHGPDHPTALDAANRLGVTLLDKGDRAAAEAVLRRALADRERTLGPDHLDTLSSAASLGVALLSEGDTGAAELLLRRAMTGRERALGPDDPNTLFSVECVAHLHQARGEFEAAEPLLRRVMAGQERALGPDHPRTLQTVGNLGLLLNKRENLDAAEPLMRRVLVGWERLLGPDHPHTCTGAHNLALLLQKRGDLDAAEPLFRRALAGCEKALGPDHLNTVRTQMALGELLETRGDLDAAQRIYEHGLAANDRVRGPGHPDTRLALGNLAHLHWARGKLDQAVPLFEEAVRRSRAAAGDDHPETLRLAANLGVSYKDAGRAAEAVPLLERAYSARAKHPQLDWVGDQLLDAYALAGRPADAVRFAGEGVALGRGRFKPGSAELGGRLVAYGFVLLRVDPAAAEPLLREGVAVREKLAPNAWNTANAKSLLGESLRVQKKYAEAEPLLLAGYAGMTAEAKTIPAPARDNLPAAADRLVRLYEELGRPDEAAKWRGERAKFPREAAPAPRPVK